MMKILYTINFLTNGGPTRVLLNIIKNIDINKNKVGILTIIDANDANIVEDLRDKGIEIIELKYSKKLSQIIKNKNKIIKEINSFNPNIIHTHGIVTSFICADNKVKAKKVTTIHNNMFEDYKYTYGLLKGYIFCLEHIRILKKFDLTICCSSTSYNSLKNKIKKITYIRNGIDVNYTSNKEMVRKQIRKSLNINNNDVLFIYAGNINKLKRVIELVEMFKNNHNNNEYLLILGDGPLLEDAKKINSSNVKFLGFKSNIIDYFYASDVYISNSSSEGFSISIIEALNCGLLCLLSTIPSHKECFEINDKIYIGELFDEFNFDVKKDKVLNNLKQLNKELIVDFQKKYLSSNSMASQYFEIYKGILK